MRKLKYYVAISVDGFIARPDGSFDGFLMEGEHVTEFAESLSEFDAVLMGRKTYEVGLSFGVTNPYPQLKQYVFSASWSESPDENVQLVSADTVSFVSELKQQTGNDIWLCGGASLASALLVAELVDEVIVKLNPVIFGTGISLFENANSMRALNLLSSKSYDNGVLLLHYEVLTT